MYMYVYIIVYVKKYQLYNVHWVIDVLGPALIAI